MARKQKKHRKQSNGKAGKQKQNRDAEGGVQGHMNFFLDSVYQIVTWVLIALSIGFLLLFISKEYWQGVLWSACALLCLVMIMLGLLAQKYYPIFHALKQPTASRVDSPSPSQSPPATPTPTVDPPKSLHQYFRDDFNRFLSLDETRHLTIKTGAIIDIQTRILFDFDARSEFLAFYVPETPLTYKLCEYIATEGYKITLQTKQTVGVEGGMASTRPANIKDFKFTGTVFIYHESGLLNSDTETLIAFFKKHDLTAVFRGPKYVFDRNNPPATPFRFPEKPAVAQ